MPVISYFPGSDNLKKWAKTGDVFVFTSLPAYSNGTTVSSWYSQPNTLVLNSYAFSRSTRIVMTKAYLPELQTVGKSAFEGCSILTEVSLPKCLSIENYAFQNATGLSQISLPACQSVNSYAFSGCSNLKTFYAPNCSLISNYAFAHTSECNITASSNLMLGQSVFYSAVINSETINLCKSVIGSYAFANAIFKEYFLSNSNITLISDSAFQYVSTIDSSQSTITIFFSNVTEIGNSVFYSAQIEGVALHRCTKFGTGMITNKMTNFFIGTFASMPFSNQSLGDTTNLTTLGLGYTTLSKRYFYSSSIFKKAGCSLYLYYCSAIYDDGGYGTFEQCTNLSTLDAHNLLLISGSWAFRNCGIKKLYLRYPGVCELTHSAAFSGTPIASGSGSIYVPSNYLASYKVAENWSYYSSRFVSI